MTVQNGTEQDPRFNAEHSTPMEQPVLPPYVQLYKSPQRGYFLPTISLHSQFTSLYLRILFLQLQYLQHIFIDLAHARSLTGLVFFREEKTGELFLSSIAYDSLKVWKL